MPTQGPNHATTCTDGAPLGDTNWTTPQKAADCDGIDNAQSGPDSGFTTDALYAKGFGFTVPAGATIDGVAVTVKKSCSGNAGTDVRDLSVILYSGTAQMGNDKADLATTWPNGLADTVYGGPADSWGASITPAVANGANFGVKLRAQNVGTNQDEADVQCITVTITYTLASVRKAMRAMLGVGK